MELPKYDPKSKKAEDGITIVKTIIEKEFNWIFRKNHQEDDFGIDAFLDVVNEKSQLTGKSIAIQVKTGDSFFKEKNSYGWIFRGEMRHLNYYLNYQLPVVIIIVNDSDSKSYWCLCDGSKTDKAGDNWKITIPFHQKLNREAKQKLEKHLGPVTDYASQLEGYWTMNRSISESGRLALVVDRQDIEKKNFSYILQALDRLETNEDLLRNSESKVDIWISGYDSDSRDLMEIEEVKEWVREIYKKKDSWGFLLSKDEGSGFLKVLFAVHSNSKRISKKEINYDTDLAEKFILELFGRLNRFCDEHHISDEKNIELSDKIVEHISGMKIDSGNKN
jgi:hypothetical protein